MRDRQPQLEAPISADQQINALRNAVLEVNDVLLATTEILSDVSRMVLDYLDEDNPNEIDEESLKEVCSRAIVLCESTNTQFGLGVDTTPTI